MAMDCWDLFEAVSMVEGVMSSAPERPLLFSCNIMGLAVRRLFVKVRVGDPKGILHLSR